ncbi:CDGSH iron-sulfur domain-containing protein [Streptomyces sp. NPDC047886]|uniref:CDGSH iron-sulfur domain-containing protein n=1 Tax=Streptomyces sp. NPDC047886 TaxID=3365490 RepID=UPI0037223968
MPSGGEGTAPEARTAARVVIDPAGPLLLDGPVEVRLPDGTVVRSDRFKVALCVCRRSRRYPWCDTSHRRRSRREPGKAEEPGEPGKAEPGGEDDRTDEPEAGPRERD